MSVPFWLLLSRSALGLGQQIIRKKFQDHLARQQPAMASCSTVQHRSSSPHHLRNIEKDIKNKKMGISFRHGVKMPSLNINRSDELTNGAEHHNKGHRNQFWRLRLVLLMLLFLCICVFLFVSSFHFERVFSYDNQDKIIRDERVETMIRYFQESVAEKVEVQIGSWFRHQPGVPREELGVDHLEKKTTNINVARKYRNMTNSQSNTIIWDDEKDVSPYFDRLIAGCSEQALSDGKIEDECFGFLQNLIMQPRCTVRLDSRTVCGNQSKTVAVESILGPQHLSHDTINVVIVGMGPVGLFLANALTEMQYSPEYNATQQIRIVMFETRVYENGHKKPYMRDWITALGYYIGGFEGVIDSRIRSVLDGLFKGGIRNTALPINGWETLLLLSIRESGVKFIYEDLHNFKHLLREVPNLLMFDATGHRLFPLNRGNLDDGSEVIQTTIDPKWKPSSPEMETIVHRFWGSDLFDVHEKKGIPLRVATRNSPKQGQLLYPVLENGRPYDIHMFKLMNLMLDKDYAVESRALRKVVNGKNYKWVGPVFSYKINGFFKDSIARFIETKYLGFSVRAHFEILTPAQGVALQNLIQKYSTDSEPEIPLSRIPTETWEEDPLWRENAVGKIMLNALRYYLLHLGEWGGGPRLSAFRMKPYIYKDPLVPGGYDLGDGKRVPMLRIGDSLFTGDPNCGSGLEQHMQTVRFFQCRLMNVSHDNCDIRLLERRHAQKELQSQG